VATHLCPSDVGTGKPWVQVSSPGGTGIPWARGNYGANAGAGYYAPNSGTSATDNSILRSGSGTVSNPYRFSERTRLTSSHYSGLQLPGNTFFGGWVMGVNSRIRPDQVTDGLSKTVLIDEIRIAINDTNSTQRDLRGTWALGVPGGSVVASSGRNDCPGPNISLSGWDDIQGGFDDPANGMGVWTGGSGSVTAKSRHAGGVMAVFCDGSVQWVADTISRQVYYRIHSRLDGLTVTANDY
jgi:prepilin-type processing-associated H-X9-DG protein